MYKTLAFALQMRKPSREDRTQSQKSTLQQQNKGKEKQNAPEPCPRNPLKIIALSRNRPFYQSILVIQDIRQCCSSALSKKNSPHFHTPHLSYSKQNRLDVIAVNSTSGHPESSLHFSVGIKFSIWPVWTVSGSRGKSPKSFMPVGHQAPPLK